MLAYPDCEKAEDFGFCARAASVPWAECDGGNLAGGIAGRRAV